MRHLIITTLLIAGTLAVKGQNIKFATGSDVATIHGTYIMMNSDSIITVIGKDTVGALKAIFTHQVKMYRTIDAQSTLLSLLQVDVKRIKTDKVYREALIEYYLATGNKERMKHFKLN